MLSALVKRCRPLPAHARLLVLGGGYSGRCVAKLARQLGTPVLCTRRVAGQPDADLIFDSSNGQLPDVSALQGITHLLSTIPPQQQGGDPVISALLPLLKTLSLEWAGYLSTTGVYGNRNGGWVQENDPPAPGLDRSRRRLECEQDWLNSGLPVQILRLPRDLRPWTLRARFPQTGQSKVDQQTWPSVLPHFTSKTLLVPVGI